MLNKKFVCSGLLFGLSAFACSQPPVRPLEERSSRDGANVESRPNPEKEPENPVPGGTDPVNGNVPETDPEPIEPDPIKDPGIKDDTDPTDPPVVDPAKPDPKPEDMVTDPGTEGNGNFEIGPNYADAPDSKERSGIAKGTVKEFTMDSKDSKIYRGQDSYLKEKGNFTRKGWVYIPAGYVEGAELPFMLVGDGDWRQHKDLMVRVLNNLIADKKIPPMAAVFINPGPLGGGDGPGSQRSFEYDSVNGTFGDWVESEVLPKVTADFKVKFTSNPEGRGTMGGSSSGAMAFTMAWFKPDKYRRILTYSGTFVNRIQTSENPKGAWEYHTKLIPNSPKKPMRVFIHASENDLNFASDNDWPAANRAMAKVMKDKGYNYRFVYSKNSGHIDEKVYRQTLPESMIWLWRGYPIPK